MWNMAAQFLFWEFLFQFLVLVLCSAVVIKSKPSGKELQACALKGMKEIDMRCL
jgi:hypothetical protein